MIGKTTALQLAILWTLGMSGAQAAQAGQQVPFNYARDIGLFTVNSQGEYCLSINNAELKPGREINLIWVPVSGERQKPEVRRTMIAAKLTSFCDKINQQSEDSSYQLVAQKLDANRVYFAVTVRPSSLRWVDGEPIARLGNQDITFRSCTSSEGLHFTAWLGSKPKAQRIWQRYYYLGYDVEPTCTERDFEEIKP